jgi:hypothetical protein
MKFKIQELRQKQVILRKADLNINDKLTYAIKRIFARIELATEKHLSVSQESIADFTVAQASVDEKGILIMTGDKYSFTPQARQAIQKFVNEETVRFNQTEVEIEPYVIADTTLPGYERSVLLFDDFDQEELTGLLF